MDIRRRAQMGSGNIEIDSTTIYYTSSDGNIVTPYNLTDFGANIVSNNYINGQGIISFDRPVTRIGGMAFKGCSSLTSVTIPDSVTSIGVQAFWSCNLTSVTIPDSVTTIENGAFRSCGDLTSVTIGDSVTSIGNWAFGYCTSLTSVTIPDSVTSIGNYAFSDCYSLTSAIIGDGVTTLGEFAFSSCSSLTSVTIGNRVKTIGRYAFDGCKSLISVTIPDSVTTIGDVAFEDCSSLTSVTIGNSVNTIGYDAFSNCSRLTSVTIPDSVTAIKNRAFRYCSSLTSVTIGNRVKTIYDYAFSDCYSLTNVYCKAVTPPTGYDNMFSGNASGRKIYVTMESVEAYKSASGWSEYADAIVGYDVIYYTSSDGNIVTPYATDVFGANIVSNNYINGQGIISFDGKVTKIGKSAFGSCSSLASVTIPDSVTMIEYGAFIHCTGLKEVYCKAIKPATIISSYVFYNNASGRKIYVPMESVEAYKIAQGWSEYASDIVGYNF